MSSETVIAMPDQDPIRMENSGIIERAQSLKVSNQDEHGVALEVLKSIATAERRVKDLFSEPKAAAHKAHKAITEAEKKLLDPLQEARGIVSRKANSYEIEEQRKADEERQRLELEAKKQEEDRKLAEAASVEASGDKEAAEQIIEEPIEIPVIHVAPKVAEVKGISSRETFRAEVVDFLALVTYVAANPNKIALLQPNQVAINQLAKSMREGFELPGCRLIKDRIKSVKAW